MLVSSGAPLNLWMEVILSACHIHNRISYKKFLGSKFDMKDLGEAKVILGIKITRTPNGFKLSQEHYVEKILKKFEHFDCKRVAGGYMQWPSEGHNLEAGGSKLSWFLTSYWEHNIPKRVAVVQQSLARYYTQ